jgi:hypothetical protein
MGWSDMSTPEILVQPAADVTADLASPFTEAVAALP